MASGESDYILHGPSLDYIAQYTSAGKFIFDQLQKDPEFIGQIEAHTGHKYTYAEILDRSIRLALWLQNMDIKPGDVVGYVTYNHKDVIIVFYATLFVGGVLSSWDPSLSTQDIAYFMDRTKPKIVICSNDAAVLVRIAIEESHIAPVLLVHGEVSGFISFEDTQIHLKTNIDNFKCAEVAENDVALFVCTSGTSSLPKIVQRTQKSILLICQIEQPSIGPVFITFARVCWSAGVRAALQGPSAKFQRVVAPYFDEELAWKWIETYQVNYVMMSTAMFLRLIYANTISKYDVSSLHVVAVGGATLDARHCKHFENIAPVGTKLCRRYGTTEFAGTISIQTGESSPGSSGPLISGTSAKIIDLHTGKTISPYELGELCLKHPKMFTGYYKDPVLSKLVIDPDGWYHTGDLARFDKKGELFIIDRLKDVIDINGVKVTPSEFEAILMQHPEVEYVGVVGKRVSYNMEHPAAFVTKTLGSKLTEVELCNFVKAQVADDAKQLLGDVRFIDRMPRSCSGKVKRWELRKMLESETWR